MEGNTTANITAEDIVSLSSFWLFSLIGSPGNAMIVYLSVAKKVEYHTYTGFIVNMALADLFMQLVGDVFLQAGTVFLRVKPGWEPVCIAAAYTSWLGAVVSFFNLPLLSFNRFIVFYYRDLEGVLYTRNGVLIQAVGGWVVTCILLAIFTVTDSMGWEEYGFHLCGPVVDVHRSPVWLIVFFYISVGGSFVLFYVIVVVCNVKVYQKMTEHSKEAGSDTKANKSRQESTRHVLKLTATMCTLPLFLEIPGMLLMPLINGTYMVGPVCGILIHLQSVINPYLTIYFMKPYLRAAKLMFGFGKGNSVGAVQSTLHTNFQTMSTTIHPISTIH